MEYFDQMSRYMQRRIAACPVKRLMVRHRAMEQQKPAVRTEAGVAVGMEEKERGRIAVEGTRAALRVALTLMRHFDVDEAVATDGSYDKCEARSTKETGQEASAWGSWDGRCARGGALPGSAGNQVAELVAVLRTLQRMHVGQKVLILMDCKGAMEAVEEMWRGGRLDGTGDTDGALAGGLVRAIVRERIRISEADERGREGGVIFMWVPTHQGGVSANAYADAAAKSHLGATVEDASDEGEIGRLGFKVAGADGGREWRVLADRSVRRMAEEQLTAAELRRLGRRGEAGMECERAILRDAVRRGAAVGGGGEAERHRHECVPAERLAGHAGRWRRAGELCGPWVQDVRGGAGGRLACYGVRSGRGTCEGACTRGGGDRAGDGGGGGAAG